MRNSNYELSLLRWGLQTLLRLKEHLELQEPEEKRWREILDKLAEYPQDEAGYRISSDMRLDEGHRHYSHLLMFYPLHLVDGPKPDHRPALEKSLNRWLSLPPDAKGRTGYTYTGASCLYSTLGRGAEAHRWLREFLAGTTRGQYPVVQPNTFYRERGPAFESPMLCLQAVPDVWKNLVFHNLRTQGAFLISAERRNGKTQWVRILSLAGVPCRIEPGIAGRDLKLEADPGVRRRAAGDGVLELGLMKGQTALLFAGSRPALPVTVENRGANHYRIRWPGLFVRIAPLGMPMGAARAGRVRPARPAPHSPAGGHRQSERRPIGRPVEVCPGSSATGTLAASPRG